MTFDAKPLAQASPNDLLLTRVSTPDASQRFADQLNMPGERLTSAPPAPPADTPQDKIDKLFLILQALPASFELSQKDFLNTLSAAGVNPDPRVLKILDGVTSVSKNGNHIVLHRDTPSHVVFNQDVIKGLVSIRSLDLGTLSFDLNVNGQARRIDHIDGLSLTLTEFGHDQSVRIEEARLSKDAASNSIITGMIENPIPPAARKVLDIADKVPVSITLTKNGGFEAPLASTVLKSAADATGPSLPGLVLHDELSDAAQVAQFAQKYPQWMSDTVTPVLTGLEQIIAENEKEADSPKPAKAKTQADHVVPKRAEVVNPKAADQIQGAVTTDGTTAKAGKDLDKTVKIDGQERHYILHLPPGYDGKTPLPMIVALHGMGGSAAQIEQLSRLNRLADKEGVIVAYPDSTDWFGQKDWKTWDTDNGIIPPGQHADDIKFLRNVIDDTQSHENVDAKRIYMTGISNGGMMTYHAAAALSDKIAAIAVVSGAMSGKEASPTEPISVLNIHGSADTVIPIGGIVGVPDSLTELGIPTFEPNSYVPYYWNKKDGMTGPPTETHQGNQTIDSYTNPKDGAEVEQIVVNGGQHIPDNVQQTMDTVWQFFKDHPKIAVNADNVPPANDPIQNVHTPVSEVDRLKQDIQKRGIKGLEADLDREVAVLPTLEDGSINPGDIYKKINDTIHQNLTDPVSAFIATTNDMSKQGNHYSIKRANVDSVPIDFTVPGTNGIVKLKNLEIGNASFDLQSKGALFQMNNVKGLQFKASVFGHDLTSDVKSLSETKLADGNHAYSLEISNPLPSFARFVLMQPDDITVKVELDAEGKPQVTNQKQITDDALGRNPFVRGAIDEVTDVANAFSNPSLGAAGNVLKDIAITGGATLLAGKLGFIAAPAIIHELDNNL